MTSAPRTAVSKIIADKTQEEDEEPKKKSREDWRKAKELEEARKAGTAPAAVDEEGKDINPHIPQYISAAPWYYGAAGPTLRHQRPQDEKTKESNKAGLAVMPDRGINLHKTITKFRKGACENCGAVTHKKKDCLERPRKIGAKYSEVVVAHDEFIPQLNANDFDGKRDRWNNYDPAQHKEIVEEFEKIEEAKRQLKAEKLKDNPDAEISDDDEADEDKYADDVDMPGTKVDSKQRITVRNLRIREDTAKYLRNLDPNSAYYDPKTRSMRDNPNPQSKEEELEFAGENFVRFTGDTHKHTKAQLFAWEAYEKGVDIHLLAEPTKLELLQHEYEQKKNEFKSKTKDHILEKYGGEEHLKAPPKTLLLAQTEEYVEYSRSGKIIKGQERQKIKSVYEEDILINNHTTVWGSYWNQGRWGFKCCQSFVKNSYCVGSKNVANEITATVNNNEQININSKEDASELPKVSDSDENSEFLENKKNKKKKKDRKKKRSKDTESKDEDIPHFEADERKRPYNSMYDTKAPTDEQIEEYMLKRKREDDPMLQFMK